jgi:hypothetical protein
MWLYFEIVYRILGGKPVGKWQTERHRRRWKDSVKMGLREINCQDQRRVN